MSSVIDQLNDVDPSQTYSMSGAKINLINDILRSLWRGDHIIVTAPVRKKQQGANGVGIIMDAPIIPGAAPGAIDPFTISAVKHLVDGVWDNTYDVTLYPGVINQFLPSNIFDLINQGISSTQYVVLTCTSDGTRVTDATWSLMGSQPSPPAATEDMPPSTFYILIGVIFYNASTTSISIYQIVHSNLGASPEVWTQISRSGAGPYDLPYVNLYVWEISEGA